MNEKNPSGLVPLEKDTVESFQALNKIEEENNVTLNLFNAILRQRVVSTWTRE